ncbi:MAG: hypothetical protein FWC69_06165, partial [Defluviitaleaceae bacterium]|nr:hypothetical protein [Defluviitaleaceae bacterium]
MDDRLFVPLLGLESFNSVVDLLGQEGAKAALLTGLVDGQKSHLAAGVARHLKKSILFITHNEEKAKEALQDLAFFANYPTFNLPPLDFMIGIADVSSKEVAKERLQTLETLLQGGEPFVVVAAADALLSPLSPKEKFVGSILNIGDADEINLGEAAEKLVNMGYIRSEQVEGCGQFAIRGGILDVFAPNNDNPLRIELWGDEVDSIRAFDPITQRSIEGEKLLDAQIYPMAELLEGDGEVATLFDYIPKDTLVVFDEAPRIVEAWERKQEEKTTFLKELLDQGKISPQACEIDINHNSILKEAEGFDTLFLSLMATSGLKRFKIDDIIGFEGRATTRFKGNVEALREELAYLSNQSYQAIVIAKHKLDDITRLEGEISQGFEYPQIKFAILNFDDGAEKQKKRRRKRGRYKGLPINHFSDLKVGDYVVHDAHGLGMYHGIEKIHVDGVFRDYFKIGFKGDANLYVATSQLDVLQKYIGGEGAKPALNRLGGEAWQKTKTKARMAIEETAKEIVELYAKRDSITGYAFTPDTVWQGE